MIKCKRLKHLIVIWLEENNVEARAIWEIDNTPVWGNLGNNMNITQDKLSAFTNPPITNLRKNYDNGEVEMEPTILHSLSISFNYLNNGNVSLSVDYDDGVIEDDFRGTGNMLIPQNEHITLSKSKVLKIDRTETPNTKVAQNGSFYIPSKLIVSNESKLTLKYNSKIILEDDSSLIFNSGSEINFEALSSIEIKSGSLLCIDSDVSIDNANNLPKIILDGGFYEGPEELLINNSVNNDLNGLPNLNTTQLICNQTNGYLHMVNEVILPHSNCNTINLDQDNLKITSSNMITLNGNINIMNNSNFEAYITGINVGDCNQTVNFVGSFICSDSETTSNYSIKNQNYNKEDQTEENRFKIYPNPLNNSKVLKISSLKKPSNISINIYDIVGRNKNIKYTTNTGTNVIELDLTKFNKGIYLLKIKTNNKQFFKKK